MALKEPKSMAEIHRIRKGIAAKIEGMTLKQKLAWIDAHAKMLGKPYVDPLKQFKKAS